MKNLKKLLGLALALAIMAPAVRAENSKQQPRNSGGGVHNDLSFYGMTVAKVASSAVASLIVSGEGFLDMICLHGGAAGTYAMAFDSGIATGLTVGSGGQSANTIIPISAPAWSIIDSYTAATPEKAPGCWAARWPIRFVNGLVGTQNGLGVATYFWHKADGTNP